MFNKTCVENEMQRNYGFDFIRAVMIFIVFWSHAILDVFPGTALATTFSAFSPGLTMSLLAFLSAQLLSDKPIESGSFIIRRGLRIFIPVWTMMILVVMVTMVKNNGQLSPELTTPQTLLHGLGLSAFGIFYGVVNQSIIGHGLWFITAIFTLYLFLPALIHILSHRNAAWHLVSIVGLSYVAHEWIYESESFWNVVIGFSLGVYAQKHKETHHVFSRVMHGHALTTTALAIALMIGVWMCTAGYWGIPKGARDIAYVLYPLVMFPWLLLLSKTSIIRHCKRGIVYFATISFEFYLVHFYFLYDRWLPRESWVTLFTAFAMSIAVAAVLYNLNTAIARRVEKYFFPQLS